MHHIKDKIYNTASLIHTMAVMNLRSQANTLFLSYLWWVLEPLLYAMLFYFVFKYLLQRGGNDFFIFLLVGKIFYLWFSKSVTVASSSINAAKGLISQRNLSKYLFPLIAVVEVTYKQILAFCVLLVMLLLNGYADVHLWWQIIPLIFLQFCFVCGLGFAFSLFMTYFPDFKMLLPLFMMSMMFSSGVFWDVNAISNESIREILFVANPLLTFLDSYRQVLMYGNSLQLNTILPACIISVLLLIGGAFLLNWFSPRLTRRLFQ